MSTTGEGLHFDATLNDSQFQASMNRMNSSIRNTTNGINSQGSEIEMFAKKAAAAGAALFSIQAAQGFISSLVAVRSQFQQLEIAFSTMLQSKAKSDQLMKELVVFAGTTPFGLKEAAGAAKQLLAYGSSASSVVSELRMLGDVASGVSVPIGDLVYLYGTLKTQGRAYATDIRQFAGRGIPIYQALADVLKINKDRVQEYVTAGKVGFPEVEQAFKNMTAAGSMFGGLMEAQSHAWAGQIERFKDAWDVMLNDIAKSQDGLFADSISSVTFLVENYQKVLEVMGALIATYGTYRAALIVTSVLEKNRFLTETIYNGYKMVTVTRELTAAQTLQAIGTKVLTRAELALKAVMLINPYVAAATALAALTAAVYLFRDSADNAVNAQKEVNKAIDDGTNSVASETIKIKDSIKVLNDSSAALSIKTGAVNDLRSIMPDYLKGYTDEQILAGKATDAILAYSDALVNTAVSKSLFDQRVKLKLDQLKTEKLSIDDKDTGFGLMDILSNKSFNDYKKEQLAAQNELLKANDDAIKAHNDKIARETKTEESKPVIQNKKFYQDQVDGIQSQIEGLNRLDKNFASRKAELLKELAVSKSGLSSFDVSDKANKAEYDSLKRKNEMLQKIYDLNDKYNNKSLTDDEQKLAEIRSEFKSLQIDIDAYNKDPRNKKINPNLKPALEKALQNQQFENDTEKLKIELDRQKALYQEYEDYKSSLGETAAKERYDKELKTDKTMLQILQAGRDELLKKDKSSMSGQELDRLNDYDKRIAEELKTEKSKYDALVKAFVSYNDQRKVLIERYNADILALENSPEAKAARTQVFIEDLKSLDDVNVQKLEAYKGLYSDLGKLSDANARKVISSAQTMLEKLVAEGKVSKELADQVKKMISESTEAIDSRLPDKLITLANSIDDVASSVSKISEGFGDVLQSMASVVGQVGNFQKSLATFNKEGATSQEKFAAGANMVAIGIGAATDLANIFIKSAQERKKAEEDYYASVLKFQNDYNLSLNEEIRLRTQISDNVFIKDLKGKITDGTAALIDANGKYLKSLQDLQAGQAKLGQRNAVDSKSLLGGAAAGATIGALIGSVVPVLGTVVGGIIGGVAGFIGGLFGGKKKKDVFGSLLAEYPELFQNATDGSIKFNEALAKNLINNNLVDDKTKALLQNTLDLAAARQAALEQINSVISDLAGDLGSNLQNTLVDAFKTGEDSAIAFGKTVEGVLENIVAQMLFAEVFGASFDKLQKEMKDSYDIGGDQNFVDDITRFFNEAGPGIEAYNAGLKAAQEEAAKQGLNLFGNTKDNKSEESLQGSVQKITATQADTFIGHFAGFRLTQLETNEILRPIALTALEHLNIARQGLDHWNRITANTLRTADNTDPIKDIKASLISIDKKMDNNNNTILGTGR